MADDSTNDSEARLKAIHVQPTSYSELAAIAQSSVSQLDALGVEWRNRRFARYLDFLQETTRRSYPRRIDWSRDREPLLYETEAIGQFVQLSKALTLLGRVDPVQLLERLREALSGSDVVEDEEADDRPRNVLLELTTASMLYEQGFEVELVATGLEDLVMRVPGAPAVPVECKRPTALHTVHRNVNVARRQLLKRKKRHPDGGIIVIGLDRALGISSDLTRLENAEQIHAALTDALHETALEVIRRGGEKLRRVALVISTVIVGAVFSTNPTMPMGVHRMTWAPLPVGGPRQSIVDALASAFKTRGGAPLSDLLR